MTTPAQTPPLTSVHRWGILVAAALMLCILAYLSGLFGGFLFDDFPNIVNNPQLRALDGSWFRWSALAVSSNAGPLRRPISMLSFGMDYYLFGFSPLAFKLTNLAIHLANGVLLYQLAQRIATRLLPEAQRSMFASRTLALLTSALWLLHPLNVSTVVYVVQRMDELAALFTLAGLLCYAEGRERIMRGEPGLAVALFGLGTFGLLAVFSKENGALITAFALVIETCCYRFAAGSLCESRAIKACFWLTVALPIFLSAAYLVLHPQWLTSGYLGRDFTLYQRLLSEARILCDYLLWIFVPLPHWMGVYHDDFVASTGLLQPATTLAAIALLLALGVTAWHLRYRSPGFSFAVAWFLVGQSMESSIIPLELIFDHRNYLPMAGLLLGVVCSASPWLMSHLRRDVAAATCAVVLVLLAGTTATWAYAWGDPLRLAMISAADHPDSSRAQYEAGRQIVFKGTADGQRNEAELKAIPYFERSMKLDPTDIFSASSLILIRSRQGKTIPPDAITNLAWRVQNVRQAQINPFLVVMTAATQGNVKLSRDQMQLLVYAALNNTHLTHSMRAMVLNNYGHYMFQIVNDNQAAVGLTVAAAAEDPTNPLFEINLTRLAIVLGDDTRARRHLLQAKRLDKARMYTAILADLQKELATFTEQPAAPQPTTLH